MEKKIALPRANLARLKCYVGALNLPLRYNTWILLSATG